MNSYSTAAALLATGTSVSDLRQRRRDGSLERLRWGVYVPPAERDLETRHRLLVESSLELGQGESVASFASAAILHGLPVWGSAADRVHLTRSRRDSGRVRKIVHVHVAPLAADDVTTTDGLPVTSLARTVVDHARTVPLEQAVAAGDRALRNGLVAAELHDQLDSARSRRGIARARFAAGLLDGASESAGESFSRVTFVEGGLPVPELQVELSDGGRAIGRVDFLWREFGTVGEFDGKIKYGRLLKPGQSVADVVLQEKRREDAIRDLGLQVVRWTWDDLFQPGQLHARLRRAFARGHYVEL